MKANEAPKKIYVSNHSSGLTYNWHNERLAVNDIEYIRKDAFIERAERYIRSVADGLDRDDDVEAFISGFRNYMKGE